MNFNRSILKPAQLAELDKSENHAFETRHESIVFYGTYLDDDLGTNWGDNFAGWNNTPPRATQAEVEKDLSIYKGTAKRIWRTATLTQCIAVEPSEK